MTPLAYLVIAGLCLLFVVGAHYPARACRSGFGRPHRRPTRRLVHFAGGFAAPSCAGRSVARGSSAAGAPRWSSLVCLAGGAI
jgi:hypothetical protein